MGNLGCKIILTLLLFLLLRLHIVSAVEESVAISNQTRPTVIIIGAGAAGIAAAVELRKSGLFDVEIFEGSNRIGGRIHRGKLGNSYVELGAEWIHGEIGNKVWELMKDSEFVENKEFFKSISVVTSRGQVIHNETQKWLKEAQKAMVHGLEEGTPKMKEFVSTAEVAKRQFEDYLIKNKIELSNSALKRGILNWLQNSMNAWDGSDDWSLTYGESRAYEPAEGNQNIRWKYPAMYLSFLKFLLTGDGKDPGVMEIPNWIRLNTFVKKVTYSIDSHKAEDQKSNNAEISYKIFGEEKVFQAEHVITTVSLGHLKENWKTMFQPALSTNKANAIEKLGFGSINKIFVEFANPWWPKNLEGYTLLWEDDEDFDPFWRINATSISLNQPFDGVPLWVRAISSWIVASQNPNALECLIAGSASRYMEKLTEQELKRDIATMLRKFFGNQIKDYPKQILTSKWSSNELIRGSYSFVSVDSARAGVSAKDLQEPILDSSDKPIICFAGEATSIHQFSTVHGAYESGLREAQRLINFYQTVTNSSTGIIMTRNLFIFPLLATFFKLFITSV